MEEWQELDEIERALLLKLKKLTQRGELFWHFAGDTNKICVAFYRDTRLKLFSKKLEFTDHDGDTIVLDALISEGLTNEFEQLVQTARKSAGQYPTCEIKAATKNALDLYYRLLQD
ncbi:MAG: hypothetical protein AB1489_05135 [Acidobacteriota bacterium]